MNAAESRGRRRDRAESDIDPPTEPLRIPGKTSRMNRRWFSFVAIGAVALFAAGAVLALNSSPIHSQLRLESLTTSCDLPIAVIDRVLYGSYTANPAPSTAADPEGRRQGVCYYMAPGSGSDASEDGVADLIVLRNPIALDAVKESNSSMMLAMGAVPGSRSSNLIATTDSKTTTTCFADGVLWSLDVQDDPSGVAFDAIDEITASIGCRPTP